MTPNGRGTSVSDAFGLWVLPCSQGIPGDEAITVHYAGTAPRENKNMNNYEWQKHQARQRIDDRLREAEAHRLAKGAAERPRRNPLLAILRAILRIDKRRPPVHDGDSSQLDSGSTMYRETRRPGGLEGEGQHRTSRPVREYSG